LVNPLKEIANTPVPPPAVTTELEVVGLFMVPYATPRIVTATPPLLTIFPSTTAPFIPIEVTELVFTVAKVGEDVVKETWFP
jgi:hypothetical protein